VLSSYCDIHTVFFLYVALPSQLCIQCIGFKIKVYVALETETSGLMMYQCNKILKYNIITFLHFDVAGLRVEFSVTIVLYTEDVFT
jgi:hypothetical protein